MSPEIDVVPGLTGETLVAMALAFIADDPPLLRYNAALTQPGDALAWARGEIEAGRLVAIWRAEAID